MVDWMVFYTNCILMETVPSYGGKVAYHRIHEIWIEGDIDELDELIAPNYVHCVYSMGDGDWHRAMIVLSWPIR